MNLESLEQTLIELKHQELSAKELAELLAPVLDPVDFQDKSLMIKIPIDNLPSDAINRLYAYADWLRHLGAKNVVFLPRGAQVETIEFSKESYYTLKLDRGSLGKVEEILDWLRIAGADPDKVVVLGPEIEIKGEKNGNSEK
jgi:hypothetical protein